MVCTCIALRRHRGAREVANSRRMLYFPAPLTHTMSRPPTMARSFMNRMAWSLRWSGGSFQKELLGYPVYYSNQVTATAASAKDLYFGNWYWMGYREDPTLNLLVNPYRSPGLTILEYSFGAVYKQLQAGAIGYGVHPSA